MDALIPNLIFDDQAEAAVEFYTRIFPRSSIDRVQRYTSAGPNPEGTVSFIEFRLDGRPFIAINGGPMFSFTEAVSFAIACEDQAEVDHYWSALLADGGKESHCGWLKDKFGVSWQVYPTKMLDIMADPDRAAVARATVAMHSMRRICLATLQQAMQTP